MGHPAGALLLWFTLTPNTSSENRPQLHAPTHLAQELNVRQEVTVGLRCVVILTSLHVSPVSFLYILTQIIRQRHTEEIKY